jgi:hypothetical protein
VTLLSMAAPVLFSVLVLLQNYAPPGTKEASTAERARVLLAAQVALLKEERRLTQPISAIVVQC